MHDLYIVGNGMIIDPETKFMEVLQFRAPVKTGNIMIRPEEILMNDEMYPKFEIVEVNIIIDEESTTVMAHGQTPMFKTKKFEIALKNWLHEESKNLVS